MSVPLSKDFVAAVRNAADIVRLVSDYVPLKSAGSRLKGLCPFHQEKTPSFSVDPELQLFYCFGCNTGGDVFKFVMLYEKLEFPEAVEFLARRWGVPIPAATRRPEDERAGRVLEMNREAEAWFRAELLHRERGARARAYLEKRGVDGGTAERLGLGYAPDGWEGLLQELRGRRFGAKDLEDSGLLIPRKDGSGFYDRFRDRLMFPIRDTAGRVVAFGGRALGDSEPKYLNSPETAAYVKGEHLYGLDIAKEFLRKEGYAIVVEGYLDLAALHQAGFQNAVASLGTAFTPAQARLLARYTQRAVVSFDGDAAGASAAARSLDILLERGLEVRVAEIPGGMDPDDFIRARSAGSYAALVQSAPGYLDFLVRKEARARDLSRVEEKVAAVNALLPRLASLPSAVERASWAAKLADELRIEDDLVLQEMRGALRAARPAIRHRAEGVTKAREAEARLVVILARSAEARAVVRAKLDREDLEATTVARLVDAILAMDSEDLESNPSSVLTRLEREDDKALFAQIAFRDDLGGGAAEAEACLNTMRELRLKREGRELERSLKSPKTDAVDELLERRLRVFREIDAPFRQT